MTEREIALSRAALTRVLQRAEYIEEDEQVMGIEFDEQINQFILYLERKGEAT